MEENSSNNLKGQENKISPVYSKREWEKVRKLRKCHLCIKYRVMDLELTFGGEHLRELCIVKKNHWQELVEHG